MDESATYIGGEQDGRMYGGNTDEGTRNRI